MEQFRLLQILLSLCQTVAYAHSRGVLHRDLKPENVMLGPYGETLLLDWGIAKVMGQPEGRAATPGEARLRPAAGDGRETETQAGTIMGSPSYMAPEVASGLNDEIDQRSDVYLLGATLYEILTGRPPTHGQDRHGDDQAGPERAAVPAAKSQPGGAQAAGRHLPQGDGASQGGPLPERAGAGRGHPALRGRRAGVGLSRRLPGPRLALGQAAPQGPDRTAAAALILGVSALRLRQVPRGRAAPRPGTTRGRAIEGAGTGAPRREGVPPPGRRGALLRRHDRPRLRTAPRTSTPTRARPRPSPPSPSPPSGGRRSNNCRCRRRSIRSNERSTTCSC